jgi:succinate-semialdehyde dehydrogenase/glutarate-semialdehyde dehydrogenase
LISLDAAHRVEDQVGRSLRDGAKLILGGRRFRPSGLPGHFFQPTILTDVRAGNVPTREEILGPVITITPVADAAEAIRGASGAGPGFGAWIYTRDSKGVRKLLESAKGGRFRINDPASGPDAGPFCGMLSRSNLEVALAMERKPWWFPYANRPLPRDLLAPSRPW